MNSPSLILLLAQMCVAEIGFQPTADECVLMVEINDRNARGSGIPLADYTRQFNAYWRSERQREQRPWIAGLSLDATQPPGWPKVLRWDTYYRPAWVRYVEAIERYLDRRAAGTYRPICRRANDYGGRCDDNRGACDVPRHPCARLVWCLGGNTNQHYWDRRGCKR